MQAMKDYFLGGADRQFNSLEVSQQHQKDEGKTPDGEYDGGLTDGSLCSLCCAAQSDAVLMPCGHSGICFLCAFAIARAALKPSIGNQEEDFGNR